MSTQVIKEKDEASLSNTNDDKTEQNDKNCSSKYLKDELQNPFQISIADRNEDRSSNVITSNSNTEIVYQVLNTKMNRNIVDKKNNIIITENISQKKRRMK